MRNAIKKPTFHFCLPPDLLVFYTASIQLILLIFFSNLYPQGIQKINFRFSHLFFIPLVAQNSLETTTNHMHMDRCVDANDTIDLPSPGPVCSHP